MLLASLTELPLDEQRNRGLVHTPREIAQQPQTWEGTLATFERMQLQIQEFLEQSGVRDDVQQRPTVWLIGAGTSDYIGQSLSLLLREHWGCEVMAVASTDLLPNMDAMVVPGRRALWVSFSRSGESPEGVAVLQRAAERFPDIPQLVVTCNAQARMVTAASRAARSLTIVLDDAVNDRSLVMTSSFTNMVLLGQCLAHAWSLSEYKPILAELVATARNFLPIASEAADAAIRRGFQRVCFVGSGTLAGAAQESALKVLEMTAGNITSMYETVLGLRHGPMAALDENTLLVCFASGDAARAGYAVDLLKEIGEKQIVSERIVVGTGATQERFDDVCDLYLSLASTVDDSYRPVLDVLFGQLLGLHASLACRLKPDSPSADGIINRVVGEFQIH